MVGRKYMMSLWVMLLCMTSCVVDDVMEPGAVTVEDAGVMSPTILAQSAKPAYATRALIDAGSNNGMTAKFLRLNEDVEAGEAKGTYVKTWDDTPADGSINWEKAYLLEASSISSPDKRGRRSVFFNPVQSYYTVKNSDESISYYKSVLVSWSPMTCILHKNSDGVTAAITEFNTYKTQNKQDAYDVSSEGGRVIINFEGLNGETDVMVSNAVEAQQWHDPDGKPYRLPLGHSDVSPVYDNPITYRHYMTAVRLHAYSEHSTQMSDMWGKILNVIVKNQPSACSVALPCEIPVEVPSGSGLYSSAPGEAVFTGNTEFSIVKTRMYGENSGMPDDRTADFQPTLEDRTSPQTAAYLGYAMIAPTASISLEIHTETGVYRCTVDQLCDDQGNVIDGFSFMPGYIYDVYLNFQASGSISALLLNDGPYRYYDLTANTILNMDGQNVENFHTSNCYIITPDIKYDSNTYYDGYAFLATVAGNGNGGVLSGFDRKTAELKPKRAALLWESSYGLISQVELMFGYVRFRTQKPDSGNYREGNAVIAVYDDDFNVLWSWHIWITDKPAEIAFNNEITVLDRNLGATAAYERTSSASAPQYGSLLETYGLYYQWGRKDPFMGPPEANFKPQSTTSATYFDAYAHEFSSVDVHMETRPTIADAVANPMYMILPVELSPYYQYDWLYNQANNLWGYEFSNGLIHKTIYDPCPRGYRVPVESLNVIASSTERTIGQTGITYKNGTLFFPFAGYKGVDRGMSSVTCAWKYVGDKGDYMLAKTLTSSHRARVYMSKVASWEEVGTEGYAKYPYTGYVIQDGANRRTAGSIRCIKDVELGTIRAQIATDRKNYMKGETVTLSFSASTPPADDSRFGLKSAELQYAVYVGNPDESLVWNTMDVNDISENQLSGSAWSPEALKLDLGNYLGSVKGSCNVAFRLVVTNGFGLSLSKTCSISYSPVEISVQRNDSDLALGSVNWYEVYKVTTTISGLSTMQNLKYVVLNGWTYEAKDGTYVLQNCYLDNEFTITFIDNQNNVVLEKSWRLNYSPIVLSEKHSEYNVSTSADRTSSEALVEGAYYVIINKDDKSRHLSVSESGTASISRDEYSAYDVFKLVDLDSGPYSSYTNVGYAYLQHYATGMYLSRNGSSLTLVGTRGAAAQFYFCSDWNTDTVQADNVDIIVNGGYYMDAPNYSYVRLSGGGREHYKWYVQRVTNAPAN